MMNGIQLSQFTLEMDLEHRFNSSSWYPGLYRATLAFLDEFLVEILITQLYSANISLKLRAYLLPVMAILYVI